MADRSDDEITKSSVLRDLVFNQYQAIVAGGAAIASAITLNPLPLLVWLGSELVLLPILDSGPLRRVVNRRKREAAAKAAEEDRARLIQGLSPQHARRYAALAHLCELVEANYQGLSGISQAYLSEQRGKLDQVLQSCLNRLQALQRYQRMPSYRTLSDIDEEISGIEAELGEGQVPERARLALEKNLELKQKLRASVAQVDDTVRALHTEVDSMEALVEVLHQNSMSLRDPQAISEELDSIVRQSEASERAVREMEALLRTDLTGGELDLTRALSAQPAPVKSSTSSIVSGATKVASQTRNKE